MAKRNIYDDDPLRDRTSPNGLSPENEPDFPGQIPMESPDAQPVAPVAVPLQAVPGLPIPSTQPIQLQELPAPDAQPVIPVAPSTAERQPVASAVAARQFSREETEELPASFAAAYQRAETERNAAREQMQARLDDYRKVYEQGGHLAAKLLERAKPQRQEDKEKRLRNSAKIMALTDLLSALGAGIVGTTTKGYVPSTGSGMAAKAIEQLNRIENDYLAQDREFRRMELKYGTDALEANKKAAEQALKVAQKEYDDKLKRYNQLEDLELKGRITRKQQEEMLKLRVDLDKERDKLRHDQNMERERLRGRNSIAAVNARAKASAGGGGSGKNDYYTFMESDGKTEKTLTPAEVSHYYELGVNLGLIPKEDSRMILKSTSKKGAGGINSTNSTREVPYKFKDRSKEERTRKLKMAYDAERLMETGAFTDDEIIEYLSGRE